MMMKSPATTVAAAAAVTTTAPGTAGGTASSNQSSSSSSSSSSSMLSVVRLVVLDLPVWLLFVALVASHLAQQLYVGPLSTWMESLRLEGSTDQFGFYPELDTDVTYYNRQCTADDISTIDSNDLIIPQDATREQAADQMMTHGAVLIPDILTQTTATQLRDYLETRHQMQDQLPWHEKFWAEIGRLSLGLGAGDHPIVAQALQEVGNHPVVKRTVEGILGKDPAIVEISTLTTMHGAQPQGIHTDSDYFGSSLLYSRTFLHSYTMFMALQDTTSKMGATTVCPGTHMCANADDIGDICLANGAFEVSSNGRTGKDVGLLHTGDGMMFNQNIWHRGPRNFDMDHKINRVMFIVTFVSRRSWSLGDVRIQGMGTYYYQRWNMWGHTFQDLTTAATTTFRQPWATIKALGLYKSRSEQWGISWLEHVVRQMANHMDFYADYELPEFIEQLTTAGVPPVILGTSEEWDPYVRELLENTKTLFDRLHWIGLGISLGLHLLIILLGMRMKRQTNATTNTTSTNSSYGSIPFVVRQVVVGHVVIALIGYGVWHAILRSDGCQRIESGAVFTTPFPNHTAVAAAAAALEDESLSLSSLSSLTAFPERMDVLLGSRFDAPFLGIYNRMLDYHPGNQRLHTLVTQYSYSTTNSMPIPLLLTIATEGLYRDFQTPMQGVVPRILQQDYASGYWTTTIDGNGNDNKEIVMETLRRELLMEQSPFIRFMVNQLKVVLADGRFGIMRDTVMAQRFTPLFTTHWETTLLLLFGTTITKKTKATKSSSSRFVVHRVAERPSRTTYRLRNHNRILGAMAVAAPNTNNTEEDPVAVVLQVGDRVYADYERSGHFQEGTIQRIYDAQWCHVVYTGEGNGNVGDSERVFVQGLQPYRPIVQGDVVEVDIEDETFLATVTKVHPLGTYDLLFDDGEEDSYVAREFFQLPRDADVPVSLSTTTTSSTSTTTDSLVTVGQRIKGNFHGQGEWYDGYIVRVNADGTYAVDYTDGDKESAVPRPFIRLPMEQ